MSTHKICFLHGELKKIIILLSSNTHLVRFSGFVIDWSDKSSKNTPKHYAI